MSHHGFREICYACNQPSPVGFHVPDEIWEAAVPERLRRLLCVQCFARFADEAGIQWDRDISLFPVSLATHRMPEAELQSHLDGQQADAARRRTETAGSQFDSALLRIGTDQIVGAAVRLEGAGFPSTLAGLDALIAERRALFQALDGLNGALANVGIFDQIRRRVDVSVPASFRGLLATAIERSVEACLGSSLAHPANREGGAG